MIIVCNVAIAVGLIGLIGLWIFNNRRRWKFFEEKNRR